MTKSDCPKNDHERDSSSILHARFFRPAPSIHTKSRCLLMSRFHTSIQSARNFRRLCFLMRQRFQHADIYRRPRSQLYPLFSHPILQAPMALPSRRHNKSKRPSLIVGRLPSASGCRERSRKGVSALSGFHPYATRRSRRQRTKLQPCGFFGWRPTAAVSKGLRPSRAEGCAGFGPPPAGVSPVFRATLVQTRKRRPFGRVIPHPGRRPSTCYPRSRRRAGLQQLLQAQARRREDRDRNP
jgi:hypothetical protein